MNISVPAQRLKALFNNTMQRIPDSTISESNFYIRLRAYRKEKTTAREQHSTELPQSNQVKVVDLATIMDKPKSIAKGTVRPNSSVLEVNLPNGIVISLATEDGVAAMTGVLLGVIRGMQ